MREELMKGKTHGTVSDMSETLGNLLDIVYWSANQRSYKNPVYCFLMATSHISIQASIGLNDTL